MTAAGWKTVFVESKAKITLQVNCREDKKTAKLRLLIELRVGLRRCLLFLFPAVFLVLLFPLLLGFVLQTHATFATVTHAG